MVRLPLKAILTTLALGILTVFAPRNANAQTPHANLTASSYTVTLNQPVTFFVSTPSPAYSGPIVCYSMYGNNFLGLVVNTAGDGGSYTASGSFAATSFVQCFGVIGTSGATFPLTNQLAINVVY